MRSAEKLQGMNYPCQGLNDSGQSGHYPHARIKSIAFCVAAALAVYPYVNAQSQDLPTNPQVVGGAATVSQSGNTQTVTQNTDRAIVNWGGFSIGANNSVNFLQPGSSSVILNRVVGNDPSSIFGSMTANGRVFLVNPNGIFFGAGSSIDTGGLVATTMSISDNDFMAGYFNLVRAGAGKVENAGLITVREGGFALLAADQVSNTATGVINAPEGSVMLASADRVTIDTNQDGLVGFSVSGNAIREVASVDNAGLISADGGKIMLSARGAQELTGMVVNNSGTIRAQTIEEQDGAIILSGSSGVTQSTGVLDASGSRGGNIQVTNQQGVAAVAGQLKATGSTSEGGRIVVAGQQTGLFSGASLDASGAQGGTVRVGGEFRGDAIEGITSQQTYVASSANIKADGTAGDGGSIVVWADDVTRYDGNISARGTGAGKGGDAEVSGKEVLAFNGTADLRAESGQFGELLLDPDTITITDGAAPGAPVPPESIDATVTATQQILENQLVGVDSTIASQTLEALLPGASVRLEATGLIRMNNLADNVLNMQQNSTGSLTLRSTTSGGIVFDDKDDRIQTSGGNITLLAQGSGSIDIGGLTSNGGNISLTSAGSTTTRALSAGAGEIGISSGSSLTTGSLTTTGGDITLSTGSGHALTTAAISSGGGDIDIDSGSALTTTSISSGGGDIDLDSGAALTTSDISSSGGFIDLDSVGNMSTGAVNAGTGTADLRSSAQLSAGAVTGSVVALNSTGNLTTTGAINSTTNVTVRSTNGTVSMGGAVSAIRNDGGAATVSIRSRNALTIDQAVTAQSNTGKGTVRLTSDVSSIAINQSVRAQGGATAGNEAALVNISANGNITQGTTGQIRALDTATAQFNVNNNPHFARVNINSTNGSASLRNVDATSTGGRAQVDIAARNGITIQSGGLVNSKAAAQPGISMQSSHGNITTNGATITTEQTAEVNGPQNSKANPNKVVEDVGGISIEGGTLNLGSIESKSTATSGIALFGIATASRGDTTFNDEVITNADAGISVSTTGTNAVVLTTGSGLLQSKALALTGDRDKGFFRVKTDISSLTVLGGKSVDLDNIAHGAGVLTISALGRISEATTDPNTNTEIPETDKPVGGVRIQSENIELLSLDNRSSNSYLFDGTRTNNNFFYGGAVQQDLRLIANNITFIPGTIQTKASTLVQLRPLTNSRNMQLALANATVPANTTFYTGDQLVGLLNQFNPDSVMVLGGANAIDVYGGTNAYSGNITIGSSTALADQISLGDMTLRFITNGRVFNNFGANTNIPGTWNDSFFTFPPYSTSVLCSSGQACIRNMTTADVFIKDSLQQSNPGTTRNVVFQGTGSGQGGTEPTDNSTSNSDSGGDSDGGGSGGGGGGSNDNDSGPGGVNEPSDNPGGGGNTGNPTPGDGTTSATSNPGQGTGNPGGTPGNTTDPTTPGDGTTTGTPQDGNNPTGDVLAGGGSFSGNDGSTGNTNTNTNTNTGNTNQTGNGGNTSNNNGNQNTNNPSGGGTLSDGSTPGSTDTNNGGTQVAGDPNNNGGFTGGGSNTNNTGNNGTNTNTNTSSSGTTGGSGGGTLSDGSTPGSTGTNGGTQVADGSTGGSGTNSGGFTGGGSNTGGTSSSGTSGNSGGGTFSDGSGTLPGGTQVADGSSGSSGSNSGGFTGGGASSGNTASSGTGGSSGGGTFSDGSGAGGGSSGTQLAGGSQSGQTGASGSGQSGSYNAQGSGGSQGSGNNQGSTHGTGNTTGSDSGGFAGGGAGTSGSQTAGGNSGGFTGGGVSSGSASASGSGSGSGGATFSDGSGSGSSGGTMLADGGQSGGQDSGNQGSSNPSSGNQGSGGQVGDAGEGTSGFSGGGSGTAAGESGGSTQSQTASNGQAGVGDNAAGDGDSPFGGGASGGGSGDATELASNTEETQDYPECGDEGQTVKQVSRAGQPNADMIQTKATGVRLRGDSGSLNQQRASCSRATATN